MHAKLVEIMEEKRMEVERLKRGAGAASAEIAPDAPRDFKKALTSNGGIDLIAEIKFGSPSAGIIRENADPLAIGKAYEKSGAAAISLLTDRTFFKGDLQNLSLLKEAVELPILRKDFILDEIQVMESASFGADAVLLIVRILAATQLKDLLDAAGECGMAVLTEIHDTQDLEKALNCDAQIIGINNRDLDTFKINLNTTFQLVPQIPKDRVVVSESGIRSAEDVQALKGLNIQAVLVGSALMAANDPGEKALEMVKAGG
ncbi:MAG TPA: indole-3-glycerol phosphate synthase TrpC [Desulfobacteria bacterium]|nr:indole-3-glycerol phosphate synthase TrpC [Desulfobacteria bacterium]